MTGTIPEFLTTCFPVINEIDLSYNQVGAEPAALVEFLINMHFQLVEVLVSIVGLFAYANAGCMLLCHDRWYAISHVHNNMPGLGHICAQCACSIAISKSRFELLARPSAYWTPIFSRHT